MRSISTCLPISTVAMGVLLAIAACDRNPTADEARQFYTRHTATVDALDTHLRKSVAALPGFGTPTPECPPDAPVEVSNKCLEDLAMWRQKRTKALRQFEKNAVAYLDRPNVIGVQLLYTSPGTEGLQHLADVGLTPGGHAHGVVEASKGITVDGRQIGWGRFQTSYQPGGGKQYGDGAQRPGIEVAWSFEVGGIDVHVQVWVLADHNPPASWREGFRREGE